MSPGSQTDLVCELAVEPRPGWVMVLRLSLFISKMGPQGDNESLTSVYSFNTDFSQEPLAIQNSQVYFQKIPFLYKAGHQVEKDLAGGKHREVTEGF